MSAALKLTNLSKTFPVGKRLFGAPKAGVKAVQPLSLTVEQGETLGIVGESGCGKSTLARMLVGLLPPTTGQIEIEGAPLDNADPATFGQKIQYVFQDPISSLNPRKTIRQVMDAPLRHLHGMDAKARAARIAEIFAAVNLPSVTVWAWMGVQVRRWLGSAQRLRTFNISMAVLLLLSLYPMLVS